jgi:PAS domain S-box-containing protein
LSDKPKIFFCGNFAGSCGELLRRLREQFEVLQFAGDLAAAELPAEPEIVGVFCSPSAFSGAASEDEAALRRILEDLPDGVVLVDENNTIRWRNQRFKQLCGAEAVVGQNFFGAMGETEILGPDFCPFHTSLATGQPSMSRLRVAEKSYYQLYVSPFRNPHKGDEQLIVVVRDITVEVDQQQKLQAIHQAGIELTDLQPDAVCDMTVEERIELLKSNILHHTKDLLNFDVVEIRLLEQSSGRLVPLLAVGMAENAASRALFAKPHDNGVTGFVASTGRSYLCEDTQDDPLYLPGLEDARSSITVPLMLHEEVIGTFNVESPEPRAFTENDQLFVEI